MKSFFKGIFSFLWKAWMKLGEILHQITQPVILALIFFLVITPIGFLRRFFGFSKIKSLRLGAYKNRTYWITVKGEPTTDEKLKRPF